MRPPRAQAQADAARSIIDRHVSSSSHRTEQDAPRRPVDHENLPAEKSAIEAATGRLLARIPLRSRSGKLTVSDLIVESGLRRDVIYADHPHLVDAFRAFVKTHNSTPTAMQNLAAENADLTQERATVVARRRHVVELPLELNQA